MRFSKIVLFVFSIGIVGMLYAQDSENCLVGNCHGKFNLNEVIHPAMDDGCTTCHESIAENHPERDGNEYELSSQPPELCYDCHDEKNTMKNVHSPVEDGDCTSCHNPHSSNNEYMLVKPKTELCFECHDKEISEGKFVHSPVKDQECTECHDPHQSEQDRLLKKPIPDLCFECHTDLEAIENKESVHPPFEEDCLDCHKPHVSLHKNLLNTVVPKLCFECHDPDPELPHLKLTVHGPIRDKVNCINCHTPHGSDFEPILQKNRTLLCMTCHAKDVKSGGRILSGLGDKVNKENNVHKPILTEGCTACHDVHGVERVLLKSAFPQGNYKFGSVKNYKLCFSCHNSDLLTKPKSRKATGFRNGTKNLHFLHVNREKGRSCKDCHDVHGSRNPFLISEDVRFGQWNMPIIFTKTKNGGTCLPGCHAQKSYSRK